MNKQKCLINLVLIGLTWFSLAFACKNSDQTGNYQSSKTISSQSTTTSSRTQTDDNVYNNSGDIPNLAGTKWAVRSITDEGDAEHVFSFQENIDFYKNGKWYMNRATAGGDGGTYKVNGNRLTMYHDDSTVMGSFTLDWDTEENVMEMDSGKDVWRLTYQGISG